MVQCPPTPQTGFQGSKAVAHFNTRLVQSCWTGLDSPVSSHSPFPGKGGEAYTHKNWKYEFPVSNFDGVFMWLRDQEPSCKRVVASNGSAAKSPSPAIFEDRISSCESAWESPGDFCPPGFWEGISGHVWVENVLCGPAPRIRFGVVAADLCPWHFAGSAGWCHPLWCLTLFSFGEIPPRRNQTCI